MIQCTFCGKETPYYKCTCRASNLKKVCDLPNGCSLYREPNGAGGYRYHTDEIGHVETIVWDTCLVDMSTLMAAITEEMRREKEEWHAKNKKGK